MLLFLRLFALTKIRKLSLFVGLEVSPLSQSCVSWAEREDYAWLWWSCGTLRDIENVGLGKKKWVFFDGFIGQRNDGIPEEEQEGHGECSCLWHWGLMQCGHKMTAMQLMQVRELAFFALMGIEKCCLPAAYSCLVQLVKNYAELFLLRNSRLSISQNCVWSLMNDEFFQETHTEISDQNEKAIFSRWQSIRAMLTKQLMKCMNL